MCYWSAAGQAAPSQSLCPHVRSRGGLVGRGKWRAVCLLRSQKERRFPSGRLFAAVLAGVQFSATNK
jgi:hypothetical protein